jgi:hypothetical protein
VAGAHQHTSRAQSPRRQSANCGFIALLSSSAGSTGATSSRSCSCSWAVYRQTKWVSDLLASEVVLYATRKFLWRTTSTRSGGPFPNLLTGRCVPDLTLFMYLSRSRDLLPNSHVLSVLTYTHHFSRLPALLLFAGRPLKQTRENCVQDRGQASDYFYSMALAPIQEVFGFRMPENMQRSFFRQVQEKARLFCRQPRCVAPCPHTSHPLSDGRQWKCGWVRRIVPCRVCSCCGGQRGVRVSAGNRLRLSVRGGFLL